MVPAGSTPSTLGLPVLMKFIHAELMMEAIAHASQNCQSNQVLSQRVERQRNSNPWKDPSMCHPQGFPLRNRHTKVFVSRALASAVSMV